MLRFSLFIAFVCLAMLQSFAQASQVRYIGTEQELSNSSVMRIYQDKDGYMWFGTYDGLDRYNGYDFKIFRNIIGDTNSLLSNTIYAIEEDNQRNLWVGGQNGACKYDRATDKFIPLRYNTSNQTLPLANSVHQLKTVAPGIVLAATQLEGLVAFKNNNTIGVRVPILANGKQNYNYEATGIIPRNASHSWVAVRSLGLCLFDTSTNQLTVAKQLPNQVNSMEVSKGDSLWLGCDEGLFVFDPKSKILSKNLLPARVKVTSFITDKAGMIWMGTDGAGIFRLDKTTRKLSSYNSSDSVPLIKSDAVYSVYQDNAGRKWFGTLRGGISYLEPDSTRFKHVLYAEPSKGNSAANFILSFCEDDDQHIWIGTDGAGLRRWNRKDNTYSKFVHQPGVSNSISSNFVTGIIQDSAKDIWLSTWFNGVSRIHEKSEKIDQFELFNPTTGKVEPNAWLVFEDSHKTIWAGASNHGSLYRFDRQSSRFEIYNPAITDLQCLVEAKDGNLWAGNYSDLVYIDLKSQRHKVFKIGYPVRCIQEADKNRLWLGTQEGGLLLFDRNKGTYKRYSIKDGLPSNTVLRMLQDKWGNLWLSTFNGISRLDLENQSFQNFSASDGLQSNQFSFKAGIALSTGEFLFGGNNGFNVFQPFDIGERAENAKILLSGLSINNDPVEQKSQFVTKQSFGRPSQLRLPFDQATLSFDYVGLDYSAADKLNYAYQLKGLDKGWNYVGKSRRANYSRLMEGDYEFLVKVADKYGRWSQPKSLLSINVLPPWYRTWWAYLGYSLVIIAGLQLYVSYTRRQQRLQYEVQLAHLESEKDKELAERQLSVFTNISHEFRTPLSLIINPLKKAIATRPEEQAVNGKADLLTAHKNARRLLSLVDQLLLFRKTDLEKQALQVSAINLNELCDEVCQYFTQLARDKQIRFVPELASDVIVVYGEFEKIEIALFNLVSNAFKFTPTGGTVSVTLKSSGDQAIIAVKDTGCGIPKEELDRVFDKFHQVNAQATPQKGFGIGLYLVKSFVDSHHGQVNCFSQPGTGSEFTISLPLGKEHFGENVVLVKAPEKSELVDELLSEDLEEETPAFIPETDLSKMVVEVVSNKGTMLVVDDNEEVLAYLERLFEQNFVVYKATAGEEALQLASRHTPDIVISDINMSGMSGLDLCRSIKESDELGHIPVILLTAVNNSETKLQGISFGADDYIAKPFDSDILEARVKTLLKSRGNLRKYFLESITLQNNTHKVPEEYQDFLKRCIEVIEASLHREDFNIKSFSKEMGMSHSTLYTRIKDISGQTLNGFIRSIRLRKAALLMLTENMNVSQAAFEVGFEDARYFREQFTKIFGLTPSQYIKKYRHSFSGELNVLKK